MVILAIDKPKRLGYNVVNMRYTEEIYKAIATRRPSLSQVEIDVMAQAYIMSLVKSIDEELYKRVFRNK